MDQDMVAVTAQGDDEASHRPRRQTGTKAGPLMVTIDQVAEMLQVDERTVRRYCTNGDLEFVKFGSNTLRFKLSWIDDFITKKQQGGKR